MERLKELEEYAKKNNIPIMQKEGINFLTNYIKTNGIKNILEIGSAIGYSAIKMSLVNSNIHITTIEKDINMYKLAVENISNFNLNNRINLILGDAIDQNINEKFDLIFIDAAKSQYIKFFNKYERNLNTNGVIITDNLKFHGLVEHPERTKNKNTKQLIRKIKDYTNFLKTNNNYKTDFIDIGDGISITSRK